MTIKEKLMTMSDDTFDKFVDFIFDDDEEMSDEEIERELTEACISTALAWDRVKAALEKARAKD